MSCQAIFTKGEGGQQLQKPPRASSVGHSTKGLGRYIPSMTEAILSQLYKMEFPNGECTVGCFDFAYSIVARSGSFAMVGSRLSQNEDYLKAVKAHILGMIVTTRVQFLVPDCLKRYIGGFISRLATLCTRWDMHASRKILLKHFDARAAEYRHEMAGDNGIDDQRPNPRQTEKPVSIAFRSPYNANKVVKKSHAELSQVEIFRWLYENSVFRQKWSYPEVIGEMLLLQFAFIYTTTYGLYGALSELAQCPEYIRPLREEVETTLAHQEATTASCDQMILLDSFLKECQRLHPPAAVSAHRVCVTHCLGAFEWFVSLPFVYTARVPNPETFDGFRFAKRAAAGASNTRLVDLSPEYIIFGMGVPGRWMASAPMKLVLAHLLQHFDILPGSAQEGGRGRPLLIPNKRPLLPPTTHSNTNHKPVYKVLNPSAVAATVCMKAPCENSEDDISQDDRTKATRIEFSFAAAPQPFLDPPTWEAMLKRARATAASAGEGASSSARRRDDDENVGSSETPDQQRLRREREAEYGSMAIRGRSSVSGRGKHAKASGRGYWGGRY
ncbi:Cytochrome P450 [Penicillium canariense]|uniref:Cytochrome P450 n=1 Tax=Penicillium canariense TaxID=189055 RepID=A0A9W9LTF8_9EURO|nr:Cytochrome P450 [Penicillium canariense]KAJ5174872.1 Cytochrome P450 [Penicillium canariense]